METRFFLLSCLFLTIYEHLQRVGACGTNHEVKEPPKLTSDVKARDRLVILDCITGLWLTMLSLLILLFLKEKILIDSKRFVSKNFVCSAVSQICFYFQVRLVLIGGCRNKEDEQRVQVRSQTLVLF